MLLQLLVLVVSVLGVTATNPPHIVLVVADDLGWNDVSWNNADMNTTNLQNLADAGVILNSSYVMPLCSPTRASFLTGRYPYHLGLQAGVISSDKEQFLTTNHSLLPEKLKEQGYMTHMVGKWHLGFCNWTYTPTYRGFDSHRGILLGSGSHYDHTLGNGFDFRNNETVDYTWNGTHSTTAYGNLAQEIIENHNASKPLFLYVAFQAPHTPLEEDDEYINQYSGVANVKRRKFSAMVTHMDVAIGQIRQALEDNGLMDNLLFVFISDNGGTTDKGNNYPLRGAKNTYWEGGVRTPALAYSSTLINKTGYVNSGMIHAVDWYATFLDVAGISDNSGIDGVSQWNMIRTGAASNRTEFVYNINTNKNFGAIRVGDFKLIKGKAGRPAAAVQVPSSRRRRNVHDDEDEDDHHRSKRAIKYRLYDIVDDPTEDHDLANSNTDKLDEMKSILAAYEASEVTLPAKPTDAESNPNNFDGVWSPGWCEGGL